MQQVIKDLTDDLAYVMVQLGAASIAELTPEGGPLGFGALRVDYWHVAAVETSAE